MHGYLSLDIICSVKLTVFLELRSGKTVHFLKQIMSADKYPCIFSRQIKAIVYIFPCALIGQNTSSGRESEDGYQRIYPVRFDIRRLIV